MKITLLSLCLALLFPLSAYAQQASKEELLTNESVIQMAKAGISSEIILKKIQSTIGRYDLSVDGLVNLKNSGVGEEVIKAMMAVKPPPALRRASESASNQPPANLNITESATDYNKAILKTSRTMSINKSSLHPSRQQLEKELLKRDDWQRLNISLVRYKDESDLTLEIGYVHGSILSHRYAFRVFDTKTGTVLAAGETTSWGSLSRHLAREITQKLGAVLSEKPN